MDKGVILRILLLIGVAALLFAPTVWAIRDAAHRKFPSTKAKAIWLAVVTLLPPNCRGPASDDNRGGGNGRSRGG
jgi:hypothetical protein